MTVCGDFGIILYQYAVFDEEGKTDSTGGGFEK